MASLSPTSVITSGNMKMPVIGLGTWQTNKSSDEEIEKAVDFALSVGYRHIDTAYVYQNEKGVGKAIQKWLSSGKLKREDLFVVTKLPNTHNKAELVENVLSKQLSFLQLDYVDLYLIHVPVGFKLDENVPLPLDENGKVILESVDLVSLWKGMEAQVDAGRAKSIGLSNFNSEQIQLIVDNARIKPANLQVELHVYCQQKELSKFCAERGITICGYAPLGSPASSDFFNMVSNGKIAINSVHPLEDLVVVEIAKKHNKNPAQVLLRFIVQSGHATIPKSASPKRIEENIQIFDFELSNKEMESLQALDRGSSGRLFDFKFFPGADESPDFPFNIPF